jgi:apolipoprotein N-acyltransferase
MKARDWLYGDTEGQRWRRERAARQPVRTAIEAGLIFATFMWLVLVRRFTVLAAAVFMFCAVLFGLDFYWILLKERSIPS